MVIEVRTQPGAVEGTVDYEASTIARAGDAIRLLAFPDVEILVTDILG